MEFTPKSNIRRRLVFAFVRSDNTSCFHLAMLSSNWRVCEFLSPRYPRSSRPRPAQAGWGVSAATEHSGTVLRVAGALWGGIEQDTPGTAATGGHVAFSGAEGLPSLGPPVPYYL